MQSILIHFRKPNKYVRTTKSSSNGNVVLWLFWAGYQVATPLIVVDRGAAYDLHGGGAPLDSACRRRRRISDSRPAAAISVHLLLPTYLRYSTCIWEDYQPMGQRSFRGRSTSRSMEGFRQAEIVCRGNVLFMRGAHFPSRSRRGDMCAQLPFRSGRIHGNARVSKSSRLTVAAERTHHSSPSKGTRESW